MTSTPSELFLRVQNDPLIFFLNGLLDDAMLSWLGDVALFIELASRESSDSLGCSLPEGRLKLASRFLMLLVLPLLLPDGGVLRSGV